ncbi:SH3 domain-containing protein [Butyrivibrio sp. VCB2001]|uniref:SH3 domain-containing protein n=1 Tax=Butyrivibrio sp. VCB2001 TaxID=1280667 RepID=UPI0004164996|nr:SH3 domain-containing protein [Butyrivibrio sp. VCB2001]
MKFESNGQQIKYITPNSSDTNDRWKIVPQEDFRKQQGKCGDSSLRKTNTVIGYDEWIERSVIYKSINYSKDCSDNLDLLLNYRETINTQVQILNDISSSMLPEPLDYFEVTNNVDDFSKFERKVREAEPVLVLDYIPGEVLAKRIGYRKDKAFYTKDDKGERLNLPMLMRLALDIIAFFEDIYSKGYAYTSLSTDHIVLLLDNKPRFVGLSRICKVRNDRFDIKHPNFGRQLLGYSAPEMNNEKTGFGESASVKKVMAFNLGVILASILAGVNTFDENLITDGAYDYLHDKKTREYVQKSSPQHGAQLDALLTQLLNLDQGNRLCDFAEIKNQLLIISGEIVDSKKNVSKVIRGRIRKILYDRGFGFIDDDYGGSYYFKIDQMPVGRGPGLYEGSIASFIGSGREDGSLFVSRFILTEYACPIKPSLPEPEKSPRVPRPKPTPAPTPSPIPTPNPPTPDYTPRPVNQVGENSSVSTVKPVIAIILVILLGIGFFVGKEYLDVNKLGKTEDVVADEAASVEENIQDENPDTDIYISIIVPDGNVRSGPGTGYDAISVVHENEKYIYTGNHEKPSSRVWYEIYLDEERTETGWVSSLIAEIQE